MSAQPRRRPHCLTCGSPMAGHKRQQCLPGSPATPPSPSARPRQLPGRHDPLATVVVSREASFVIPESGPWHRRNPRWVDPPPPRMPSPAESLVPTVLVDDDGNTITDSVADGNREDSEAESKSTTQVTDLLDELTRPMAAIFSFKRGDMSKIHDAASATGLHASVMHAPRKVTSTTSKQSAFPGESKRSIQREDSWWLVMGKRPGVVTQIVDSHQREMPGALEDVSEMVEGPRVTTFFQLILAGVIGGMVVVFGLSML